MSQPRCPMGSHPLARTLAGFAGTFTLAVFASQASAGEIDPRLTAIVTANAGIEESDTDQILIEVLPEARISLPGPFSADVGLRFEMTEGSSGLGTRQTYSSLSRPVRLADDVRLEITDFALSWREGPTRIRVGKQTYAWGVLDGLQVTDRLDPSRKRQAIFIDQRPDRISRWGGRAEFRMLGVEWDAAAIFDGTADQLAQPGDAFAPSAPRFRGGLPQGAPLPDISVDVPSNNTYGLRARRSLGASDLTLLAFHGPETEPVLEANQQGITLVYPNRALYGANFQIGSGAQVWRAELAYVPRQPVNLGDGLLTIDRRKRVLGGLGLDWSLGGGAFLNAQVGVDWIEGDQLLRPNTDVISTIRIQKPWAQDTLLTKAEIIGSLSDGDGTFRPSISWQATDALRLEAGVDVIWGQPDELIGQFDRQDRAWVRFHVAL